MLRGHTLWSSLTSLLWCFTAWVAHYEAVLGCYVHTTSRGATPRPPIEYKLVSTYIGYHCTSMAVHNISRGFNISLQAFQAILSLCTQTLFIVGYSTLELVL